MSENTKKCVLKIAHINARSILAGFNEFSTTIRLHDFDVVGVTETWLTSDISNYQIEIQNYDCYRCDRSTRGGGVALFEKSCYHCSVTMSGQSPHLEYIWLKIQSQLRNDAVTLVRNEKSAYLKNVRSQNSKTFYSSLKSLNMP
nr:unnamed protein product [Callosobruchus analis]